LQLLRLELESQGTRSLRPRPPDTSLAQAATWVQSLQAPVPAPRPGPMRSLGPAGLR